MGPPLTAITGYPTFWAALLSPRPTVKRRVWVAKAPESPGKPRMPPRRD